jgi:cellulose synthase/poly-beta-1,6-N-acetylglucosamine synthase-like glycosyltransferase
VSLAASEIFPELSSDRSISIIIPTFNGALRIEKCLRALTEQCAGRNAEIIVVNDGSTDNTAEVVNMFCDVGSEGRALTVPPTHHSRVLPINARRLKARPAKVLLITQRNAGPAAARNRGVAEAKGTIVIFIDDDCVPAPGWLEAMLAPFDDPEVVGTKGIYRTQQTSLAARFVQVEYEERYRRMAKFPNIDFIDTYSAAFRRDRILEVKGFDTSFPVACAEDVDLSYRMAARGWKMKFVPGAVVYHTHPQTIPDYLKKKYKFAFWRVPAVSKNPRKGLKDTHTPQLMKLQLLFMPALVVAIVFDFMTQFRLRLSVLVIAGFIASTIPFVIRTMRKDRLLAAISPALMAARACAQLFGVIGGFLYTWEKPADVPGESNPMGGPGGESQEGSAYE